jgi:anti-sigma factor RsiW
MDWNCTLTEERLIDFLDAQLSREEAAAFSAHTARCVRCSELVARIGGLVRRIERLEPLEVPPHLSARILDATLGPRVPKHGLERWFAWVPALWQPRMVMGMATVAASVIIVLHTAGLTPGKLKRADLNPANLFRTANRQAHLTYARGVRFVNELRVVYEIQSRLQPEPVPACSPVPKSSPEEPSQPESPNHDQKSETGPDPGRNHQVPSGMMLACLATKSFTRSLP